MLHLLPYLHHHSGSLMHLLVRAVVWTFAAMGARSLGLGVGWVVLAVIAGGWFLGRLVRRPRRVRL